LNSLIELVATAPPSRVPPHRPDPDATPKHSLRLGKRRICPHCPTPPGEDWLPLLRPTFSDEPCECCGRVWLGTGFGWALPPPDPQRGPLPSEPVRDLVEMFSCPGDRGGQMIEMDPEAIRWVIETLEQIKEDGDTRQVEDLIQFFQVRLEDDDGRKMGD